jgi:cysteine desulfurase
MNVPADWLQGAVRFSLSRFNTEAEINYVNEMVPVIVQRLRGSSALGRLSDKQPSEAGEGAATGTVGVRG